MKWDKKDVDTGISLIKLGYNYRQIGEILNRSENSIRSKLFRINEKLSNYSKYKKTTICLHCESEILHDRYVNRLFCSRSCSAKFNNRKRINLNENKCLNCDVKVGLRNKYCSISCKINYERNIIFEKIKNGDTSLCERNYKNYLIHLYGDKCMDCGWCEIHPITKKVPIQMEHIDGHSENNNLDNLKLLCPNCHSLTPTYGCLNKGNGRKNRYRK